MTDHKQKHPVRPEGQRGRGPGQPRIGSLVKVIVPDDMIAAADATADARGVTRSVVLREWLVAGQRAAV